MTATATKPKPKAEAEQVVDMYRADELAELFSVHQKTIWKWVSLGEFPKPLRIHRQTYRWPVVDVVAWVKSRSRYEGKQG